MHPYRLIATDRDFNAWYQALPKDLYAIAIDLEAEFNLHVYGEHFCLLQVFDGTNAVAIDPFSVSIPLIASLLESRDRIKITYDCASDRALLFKNHGVRMNAVLDLRPAVELLGFARQGLGSVLEEVLSIAPVRDKQRFQQYDWTRRPINEAALAYAIDDVVHLYRLREELLTRISDAGLTDRYLVENFKVQDRDPETDRKPGILRGNRFRRLTSQQQSLLEQLHAAREAIARELNVPPNNVFPNRELFAVATGARDPNDVTPARNIPREPYRELLGTFAEIVSAVTAQ